MINNFAAVKVVAGYLFWFARTLLRYAKWPMENYFFELPRDQGCLQFSYDRVGEIIGI